jgi:hypothetical protein
MLSSLKDLITRLCSCHSLKMSSLLNTRMKTKSARPASFVKLGVHGSVRL